MWPFCVCATDACCGESTLKRIFTVSFRDSDDDGGVGGSGKKGYVIPGALGVYVLLVALIHTPHRTHSHTTHSIAVGIVSHSYLSVSASDGVHLCPASLSVCVFFLSD